VAEDVEPGAAFRISDRVPRTTLRDQAALAERSLRADCAPEQAKRLSDALG
jgi:hypothetical protein